MAVYYCYIYYILSRQYVANIHSDRINMIRLKKNEDAHIAPTTHTHTHTLELLIIEIVMIQLHLLNCVTFL